MLIRIVLMVIVVFASVGMTLAEETTKKNLRELKVLYIGAERTDHFVDFLAEHVQKVESTDRDSFKTSQADSFDVVLLDWPQSEKTREIRAESSPLGQRGQWAKPTVLLGSAGLNIAVAWQMQGGSGCTCMQPLAYRFRDHEMVRSPFSMNLAGMVRIPTPNSFDEELEEHEIEVLPLVDDQKKDWNAGWCTYSTYFDRNPDVEIFCGGVNEKTPTAAGLWRQGNFMHFGFEQSPRELNQHGRDLLLNSIAYIARFTEDRPIATTPSVLSGPIARPRRTPARWLSNKHFRTQGVLELFEPRTKKVIESLSDREKQIDWCKSNEKYFYPVQDTLIGIDSDLSDLDVAFDTDEFFDRVLKDLDSKGEDAVSRSRRLLERYVPCGPGKAATAAEWRTWHTTNQPYLFALDTGDYCWYIDELAKRRQVPSRELRGPLRADLPK